MEGCKNNVQKSVVKENVQKQLVQTYDVTRFKLFPTQNMWTFLKLYTQTGQIWQEQYSVSDDKKHFEYDLNPNSFVTNTKRVNEHFELYPTPTSITLFFLTK